MIGKLGVGSKQVVFDDSALNAYKADNVTQMLDISVDVSKYCGNLDLLTDNTQGILNAISVVKNTKQKKLIFSEGIYAYSSLILIENLDQITVELSPNAELYDLGVELNTDLGIMRNPVGFKINNCGKVVVNNLNHDCNVGPNGGSGYGIVTIPDERVPQFSIENSNTVLIEGGLIKGQQGSAIKSISRDDDNIMNDYYLRVYKCGNVEVKNVELATNIRGEYFGFYKADVLLWHHCKHIQEIGDDTFWSFGKIIQCGNVEYYSHIISSQSTGSFVDVIADKTYIHDLHIDYPVGKFIDISNEWNGFKTIQDDVIIRNCSTNGFAIGSTMSSIDDHQKIKKIIIDNFNPKGKLSTGNLLTLSMFENVEIRNCKLDNTRYTVDGRSVYYDGFETTKFNRNILIENCYIENDNNIVYENGLHVYGSCIVRNTKFNNFNSANLLIEDIKCSDDGGSDITAITTPSTCTFDGCNFEGVNSIIFRCNTVLKNCELNSVLDTVMLQQWNATVTVQNVQGEKFSMPSSGFYPQNVFIRSTNKYEYGDVGVKYVVLGWVRLTTGIAHIINTDWRELRVMTGN